MRAFIIRNFADDSSRCHETMTDCKSAAWEKWICRLSGGSVARLGCPAWDQRINTRGRIPSARSRHKSSGTRPVAKWKFKKPHKKFQRVSNNENIWNFLRLNIMVWAEKHILKQNLSACSSKHHYLGSEFRDPCKYKCALTYNTATMMIRRYIKLIKYHTEF